MSGRIYLRGFGGFLYTQYFGEIPRVRVEEKDGTITVIYSTVIRGMLGVASGEISAWFGQPTKMENRDLRLRACPLEF